MGALAPILGGLAQAAAVGGTILQVAGTLQQGQEAKARYQYEQKVNAQAADEAEAASQRDAAQRYKQGEFIQSQQRAAIAGSGGDLTDPSVIDLMDDTQEATTYAAQSEIYKGQQQAKGYNDAAKVAGINADNAMKAAQISAVGGLFEGISSMYSRFGQQNRKTAPASGVLVPYG